jgi:hypothetical protein
MQFELHTRGDAPCLATFNRAAYQPESTRSPVHQPHAVNYYALFALECDERARVALLGASGSGGWQCRGQESLTYTRHNFGYPILSTLNSLPSQLVENSCAQYIQQTEVSVKFTEATAYNLCECVVLAYAVLHVGPLRRVPPPRTVE